MFKPLVPYTVKGVCWYQGEGNSQHPNEYEFLLTNFIKSWRIELEQPNLPFIITQLSGYKTPYKNGWARVQELQYKVSENLPFVATVMTYDLGDSTYIHPSNKQDVGFRMYLSARKLAYAEDLVAQGPTMENCQFKSKKVLVSFKNTGTGLVIKAGYTNINNFMIAGDDKIFYSASAKLIDKHSLEVSTERVKMPKYIRYAFACFNPKVNLYNSDGLPSVPFRTDNVILPIDVKTDKRINSNLY